jgi:beta-mannosidase
VRQSLDGEWQLRLVSPAVGDVPAAVRATESWPASVPGCVHTDLLAAGAIPDPYLDRNEEELAWIGRQSWEYRTTVNSPSHPSGPARATGERTDLVFDGLDTVATISVNGRHVADTRNMHRRYRFDVTDAMRTGENEISVRFESAEAFAAQRRDRLGALPSIGGEPFAYVRKMACNFGWDWGPKLVTAGIWRSAALETWATARLARVRPVITMTGADAGGPAGHVAVHCDIERTGTPGPLTVVVEIAGLRASIDVGSDADTAIVEVDVPDPDLWWPRSLGDPALHDLGVTLYDRYRVLDRWHRRVGFRTVELNTSPDDAGSAFEFIVNGVPVFARGVNWIPDDCFPARVDAARYRRRLQQAVDAGVDLVRVWGGGVYESEEFYDICDEFGLMVWQDFAFACAAYPQDEELWEEVTAEADDNVARLMPHPSLVLWNGSNENIWGKRVWKGFEEQIGDRDWGLDYYVKLLPDVVHAVDPTRPYWPSSPYSLPPIDDPNAPEHGCMHIWDVWNARDYAAYADYVPRFVSEFGYAAPPAWSTLTRAVHDRPLRPDSPAVRSHFKAIDGEQKLRDRLAERFSAPADADDWHFLNQLNQAHALRCGVEHFRSHRGVCMGTIWWQLNDCWPVTSWAVIDGDGVPKPAWYALRDAYSDRLLTLQPREGGTALIAVNDSSKPWQCEVTVGRYGFDGELLAQQRVELRCAGRATTSAQLDEAVARPGDPRRELLRVQPPTGSAPAYSFFVPDREREYPALRYRLQAESSRDATLLTLQAGSLLVDTCLFVDRLKPAARIDTMLVTLLPGEQRRFRVDGLDARDLAGIGRPVIRFANDRRGLEHST